MIRERARAVCGSGSPTRANQKQFVDFGETPELQQRALTLHRSQTTVWEMAPHVRLSKTRHTRMASRIRVQVADAFRRIVIEGAVVVAEGTRV